MTSREIAELAPEAYLEPDRFVTAFDRDPHIGVEQYRKGYETGLSASSISISIDGCWSGKMRDGSNLISYERIGYHAYTASFLRGLIDSGVSIVVYRRVLGGVAAVQIW